jgi:hypothetical protein
MFVCCKCYVLSGRGLNDELITHSEESYRLCCVVVCDLETSWMRRPWPTVGCRNKNKKQTKVILSNKCNERQHFVLPAPLARASRNTEQTTER